MPYGSASSSQQWSDNRQPKTALAMRRDRLQRTGDIRQGKVSWSGRGDSLTDPLAGLSARPSRNAGKLLTEEQLLQVARRPGTKAKPAAASGEPAAKKRKQQGEAKDISSFFKV